MTHEPIRKALAAGPTNSVWECDIRHGEMSRHAYVCAPNWGIVATVGLDRSLPHWDAPQRANAALIAACNPSAIAALLADLDRANREVQVLTDAITNQRVSVAARLLVMELEAKREKGGA